MLSAPGPPGRSELLPRAPSSCWLACIPLMVMARPLVLPFALLIDVWWEEAISNGLLRSFAGVRVAKGFRLS